MEEGMGTHSSILACRIPWTEEPGGLQSVGLRGVRQDEATQQQQAQKTSSSVLANKETS